MVSKRALPEARNPLLAPEHTPEQDVLVERRRLGQTNLQVKAGQVGIANATKPENLGVFDYAHLRAPLPRDLKGSGIFALNKTGTYPESYFLMRRSSDGHISATGMFKAAFPWASVEEELEERQYHKTLPSSGNEEVAGNVWISPEEALELAKEYAMLPWILALVDPAPIEKGPKDKEKLEITTPPKFVVLDKASLLPPPGSVRHTRSRDMRSASPSKIATPGRKIATPRKRSTRRSTKAESVDPAASALQHIIENGVPSQAADAESIATESVAGATDAGAPEAAVVDASATDAPATDGNETVEIEVDETVEKSGDTETTTTEVKITMPADHPELPLPESTEDMIAKAKEMVEKANELEQNRVNGVKALKRKVDDVDVDEEDVGVEVQPVKKARTQEEELKKERVMNRALIGLGATLAIGAMIPYFL